jgi:hypothetical protein
MPFIIFAASCFASLGATLAFQRELIEKGYEEGSMWDRRFWAYLRRYDDRSLESKRLAALAANVFCIASLVWVASVWRFGH